MSTTLSISLFTPHPNSLTVFEAMIPRILEAGEEPELSVCRDWILNVVTRQRGELQYTQAIKELTPDDGLCIDITVPLHTGVRVRINVWHFGPGYDLGWKVLRGGPLQITCSLSDLELEEEALEYPSKEAQYAAVLTGAMQVFDLMCGLDGSEVTSTQFNDANLYFESGCAVAPFSSIQYHRKVCDFAMDLMLAHRDYENGLYLPEHYVPHQIGARSSNSEKSTPLKDGPKERFTEFDIHKKGETEAFFRGLASAPLSALTLLSDTDLLPILQLAAQDVPHIVFRLHPQGGASIATHPEQGLWPFYASLLDVARTLGI